MLCDEHEIDLSAQEPAQQSFASAFGIAEDDLRIYRACSGGVKRNETINLHFSTRVNLLHFEAERGGGGQDTMCGFRDQ
ncbi:hypothetical protein H845_2416 [Komagataeibacter xylinus E25]|nr:hypothetical protein H845_2416 [Komagataeibacter xylinus E25]